MEIKEAKLLKDKLQNEISELISAFEKQTGLIVDSVSIRKISHIGDGRIAAINNLVTVDVGFDEFVEGQ